MENKTQQSESKCNNGGCTRFVYRGKYCFRCWAGIKWTSMIQRLENKMGNCNSYVGLPLGFTKSTLIQWVLDNPPPENMKNPSIDRIIPEKGYVPGNIRWLEFRKNSSGNQRDIPDGFYLCKHCKRILPKNRQFFTYKNMYKETYNSYCIQCRKEYDRLWRKKNK